MNKYLQIFFIVSTIDFLILSINFHFTKEYTVYKITSAAIFVINLTIIYIYRKYNN